MANTILILCLFCLCSGLMYPQNEANNWFFGKHCGLSFTGGTPKANYGALNSLEGCASISDNDGKLLFYTDGMRVWNRNHSIMPNGSDLLGHTSATQSSLIIPLDLNGVQYYVFTLEGLENNNITLRYSIVDMSLEGGLGDIPQNQKNHLLANSLTEKLASIKHSNGYDYWLVVHEWGSNGFLSFKVTQFGVESIPIKSFAGSQHSGSNLNKQGYMKISPNGEKLAYAVYEDGFYELFDFNKATGEVSNPILLSSTDFEGAYGVEFSADSKKLYTSDIIVPSSVYQFDLESSTDDEIIASRKLIASNSDYFYAALQLGPDFRIYVASKLQDYLGVIQHPDSLDCKFVQRGVDLNGNTCQLGLPSFVASIFQGIAVGSNSPLCEGDTLRLYCENADYQSFEWIGPDGFSSNLKDPVIPNFNRNHAGLYILTLTDISGKKQTANIFVELIEINVEMLDSSDSFLGRVCLGSENRSNISIINRTGKKIVIDKILLKNAIPYFDIEDLSNLSINHNEIFDISIEFEPMTSGKFADTLIVLVSEPCPELFLFPIYSEGLDTKTQISIPRDSLFKIGDKNLCIPIIASLNCREEINLGMSYTIEIAINPRVFFVTEIKNAAMVESSLNNGFQRILIIGKIDNLDSNESILAQICGDALLGDSDTTGIFIKSFSWSNDLIEYNTNDGFVKVYGVCMPPLTKVRQFTLMQLSVNPNPADDYVDISFSSAGLVGEAHFEKMNIYNSLGQCVIKILLEELMNGTIQGRVNISSLAPGLYMIKSGDYRAIFIKE